MSAEDQAPLPARGYDAPGGAILLGWDGRRWARRAALAALIGLGGCGARTALESELGRDGGAAASDACERLAPMGEPAEVLGAVAGVYEAPLLAARSGGYDVVSFRSDGSRISYVARRARVEDAVLPLGEEVEIGPEARSFGSLGVRGDRLVLCYGGRDLEGPTRWQVLEGEGYRPVLRSTLGDEAGDWCAGLVRVEDRWVVRWNHRPMAEPSSIAEVDDEGRLLTTPIPLWGAAGLSPWSSGYAYAVTGDEGMEVTFVGAGGGRALLDAPRYVDVLELVPSPYAASSVELAWLTREGEAEVTRVSPDGLVEASLRLSFTPSYAGGPFLASFRGRVVLARADEATGGGTITLWLRLRDGTHAEPLTFGTASPSRPSLATDGRTLLVAWSEERPDGSDRVMALAFDCR